MADMRAIQAIVEDKKYGLSGRCQDIMLRATRRRTMTLASQSKTERIDVRASLPIKTLLQNAAQARHKTVSEFLLEAGITAAHETLAEQRLFLLDDEQWQKFQELLDRPVQDKPALKALLAEFGNTGESA